MNSDRSGSATPRFDIIRTPKSAEVIAGRLRARIVKGELAEGQNLPTEAELMSQFGVSRPTLRGAFRLLEAESLLMIQRGSRGGARVTNSDVSVAARDLGLLLQLSKATIGDVYEARKMIEPAAVALLAERRTSRDLTDLGNCLDRLEHLLQDDTERDVAGWSKLAYTFHRLVIERSGNRTLALQAGMLEHVVTLHISLAVARSPSHEAMKQSFRLSIRSYRRLLELVDAQDVQGARQHWETHMDVAVKLLLSGNRGKEVVYLFE